MSFVSNSALTQVILVSIPEVKRGASADISLNIATAAAEYLPDLLHGADLVGIGWGYTMYQTSLLLPQTEGTDHMDVRAADRHFRGKQSVSSN